jgi:hypothetical protein
MKVGIMQPYFFPYLGYFALIDSVDLFILLDEVQFIRHGWIERNRTLKPSSGWQYIKCPLVKHPRETIIKNIRIRENEPWKEKINAQLVHYKKYAPNYYETKNLLDSIFDLDTIDLTIFNQHALTKICSYLDIRTPIEVFSSLQLEIKTPYTADDWALNICKAIGQVKTYINPIGGAAIFDKSKYLKEGIQLKFLEWYPTKYSQKRSDFENSLSIIDVLMFNSVKETRKMVENYAII